VLSSGRTPVEVARRVGVAHQKAGSAGLISWAAARECEVAYPKDAPFILTQNSKGQLDDRRSVAGGARAGHAGQNRIWETSAFARKALPWRHGQMTLSWGCSWRALTIKGRTTVTGRSLRRSSAAWRGWIRGLHAPATPGVSLR
jgi:hypothetical protein